jgi:hypothetical protein
MKILLDMINLLNKENEDIILIEKLKRFNHKLNKNCDDTEKILVLFETLYSDLSTLNKQYPYLNDIVLCLVDIFDKLVKEAKRKTKHEHLLKQNIHKIRCENDTLHHHNTKLSCENETLHHHNKGSKCDKNKKCHSIINPMVECNITINGSYTIITGSAGTGNSGPTGPTGSTGPTGIGNSGSSGPIGIGNSGSTGPTGIGDSGSSGPIGIGNSGSTGTNGDTGSTGTNGDTGSTGTNGDTGSTGNI